MDSNQKAEVKTHSDRNDSKNVNSNNPNLVSDQSHGIKTLQCNVEIPMDSNKSGVKPDPYKNTSKMVNSEGKTLDSSNTMHTSEVKSAPNKKTAIVGNSDYKNIDLSNSMHKSRVEPAPNKNTGKVVNFEDKTLDLSNKIRQFGVKSDPNKKTCKVVNSQHKSFDSSNTIHKSRDKPDSNKNKVVDSKSKISDSYNAMQRRKKEMCVSKKPLNIKNKTNNLMVNSESKALVHDPKNQNPIKVGDKDITNKKDNEVVHSAIVSEPSKNTNNNQEAPIGVYTRQTTIIYPNFSHGASANPTENVIAFMSTTWGYSSKVTKPTEFRMPQPQTQRHNVPQGPGVNYVRFQQPNQSNVTGLFEQPISNPYGQRPQLPSNAYRLNTPCFRPQSFPDHRPHLAENFNRNNIPSSLNRPYGPSNASAKNIPQSFYSGPQSQSNAQEMIIPPTSYNMPQHLPHPNGQNMPTPSCVRPNTDGFNIPATYYGPQSILEPNSQNITPPSFYGPRFQPVANNQNVPHLPLNGHRFHGPVFPTPQFLNNQKSLTIPQSRYPIPQLPSNPNAQTVPLLRFPGPQLRSGPNSHYTPPNQFLESQLQFDPYRYPMSFPPTTHPYQHPITHPYEHPVGYGQPIGFPYSQPMDHSYGQPIGYPNHSRVCDQSMHPPYYGSQSHSVNPTGPSFTNTGLQVQPTPWATYEGFAPYPVEYVPNLNAPNFVGPYGNLIPFSPAYYVPYNSGQSLHNNQPNEMTEQTLPLNEQSGIKCEQGPDLAKNIFTANKQLSTIYEQTSPNVYKQLPTEISVRETPSADNENKSENLEENISVNINEEQSIKLHVELSSESQEKQSADADCFSAEKVSVDDDIFFIDCDENESLNRNEKVSTDINEQQSEELAENLSVEVGKEQLVDDQLLTLNKNTNPDKLQSQDLDEKSSTDKEILLDASDETPQNVDCNISANLKQSPDLEGQSPRLSNYLPRCLRKQLSFQSEQNEEVPSSLENDDLDEDEKDPYANISKSYERPDERPDGQLPLYLR